MLVSKNKGTSLQRSERKTLISFYIMYSFLSILLLGVLAFIYYNMQKDLHLDLQKSKMQTFSNELISKLKYLHLNFDKTQVYPRYKEFESGIYDSRNRKIFSTMSTNDVRLADDIYMDKDKIYYVRMLSASSYYLGAMYVVIEMDDEEKWQSFFKWKLFVYALGLLIVLLAIGYFLTQMLFRPMRESITLLDRFIKDTTHELNTPISTILTNIETINWEKLDEKTIKKIKRIDAAARTVSHLYNDLTYASLNNKTQQKNERVDLYQLIIERADFFRVVYTQKKIECVLALDKHAYITIDRHKISTILDNLISNAIKYNKRGGTIKIILRENFFIVEDTGVGMPKDKLKQMFDRYTRFNKSEGGFGIGLNIVLAIANEYDLQIDVNSVENVGTKVKISWSNKLL